MFNYKIYSKQSINILIIVSFLLSISLSFHYLSKYDELIKDEKNLGLIHPMLKSAVSNHWEEADEIINDVKNKKNFFTYGDNYDEFLPQRILALYYLVIDKPILDENKNFETSNGKFLYLTLKTLLFYLTLIYFFQKLIKILPLKNCFFIIFFLALEPTIFQFHSSFWNESLFFPLQVLLLTYMISATTNFLQNFMAGVILGLMFTVSVESYYLIIPIILFQILNFKKKSFKVVFSTIFGFVIILLLITFHNYKRTGNIFFMNDGAKSALYLYMAPHVLSISENTSTNEARFKMNKKKLMWIEKNKIDIYFPKKNFKDIGVIDNDADRLKYFNYLQYSALNIIIKNPISTVKFLIKKNLHTLTLNPFYIKNFYKFDIMNFLFYNSETHKNEINYRIIYSIFLYTIMLMGIFYSFKNSNKALFFSLLVLAFYPLVVLGWMGSNRYFVPSLIYLSIFFGNGMTGILNKKNLIIRNE